jgi:hypothetical protein
MMVIRYFTLRSDYELGRLLSREGDEEAARTQFDLVISGKSLEATTHGRKGKYSMEVSIPLFHPNIYLKCRHSKHFICVHTLP